MKRIIAGLILFGAFTAYYGQQPTKKTPTVVQQSSGANSPNVANVNGNVVIPPEQKPAAPEAPKPPTITDAQKLKFFKAQSEFVSAQAQVGNANQLAQQKQTAYQAAIKELGDVCGKDFQPSIDAQGDPACVAKAAEPAKK